MGDKAVRKPIRWMGSSYDIWTSFPDDVQDVMGYALDRAQQGMKAGNAKPMKGFKGASVFEISDDSDGDTYRGIYTVQFKGAVYVLHAFQKKSKHGIETPKNEIDLIKRRLREAGVHYETYKT
jgi:phage-related protein